MTNNNLSDIEIKLINAGLKFSNKHHNNYSIEIQRDSKEDKSYILINDSSISKDCLIISYPKKAEEGEITLIAGFAFAGTSFAKRYKKVLLNEIPEIKDRVTMKWGKDVKESIAYNLGRF